MKMEVDFDIRELVAPLTRIAAALERLAGMGGNVYGERAAPVYEGGVPDPGKPPTQTIAAKGSDMARVFAPNATMPPLAMQARKLADDPAFQAWAARMALVPQSQVADAVAFTLEFILRSVNATKPQDFERADVVTAFNSLFADFRSMTNAQA